MTLKKCAPSRWLSARIAVTACAALCVGLAGCNKPQDSVKNVLQSAISARFLYVISCDGRVDKIDTREKKLVSSFALSERTERTERSGQPSAVPSLASAGGQMDSCLAQRVLPNATGTAVSLIAPKDARVDSNRVQDFQVLTFALPQWTLISAAPAGKSAVAPWLQQDGAGKLQVLADDPQLAAAAIDLREFKGGTSDMGGLLLQSSGDVSLLSLLFKDSTALALGVANAKTRTLVRLAELPATTFRHVPLAPGGGFVLVEATSAAAPDQRTGTLRLFDGNGKRLADVTDERMRTMAFVALTPNGLAVYGDAAGAYHFVSLGQTFGNIGVVASPLAMPTVALSAALLFAAE